MSLLFHSDFLENYSSSECYLLAISGGRDSVALFHTLYEAGYHNLVLCHLNHSLRGKESELDAEFVRQLANRYKVPASIKKVKVRELVEETGKSMELAARDARHTFFAQCAEEFQSRFILLAHHADDQAETILFNLLRGSGGLKGMQFSKTHQINKKDITFLRPFLQVSRAEIDAFIHSNSIAYREDASNATPIATRNRLRNEAIPLLSEMMGRDIKLPLLRAAEIAMAKDQAMREILDSFELYDPQGRLFVPKLLKLPVSLLHMALQDYLKAAKIPNVSQELLLKCASLLEDSSVSKMNLPGGKYLRRKEKRLFISS